MLKIRPKSNWAHCNSNFLQLTPNRVVSVFFLQGLPSRQWDGAGSRRTETFHMDRQQAEMDALWVCILCFFLLLHNLEGEGGFKVLMLNQTY